MANRKSQHFVPSFYLKRFSINDEEKALKIFLPNHNRFIEEGGIAGQASRDYYYGKDGIVENGLSEIEGKWAAVLKDIDNGNLPRNDSEEFRLLLEFICFTDFRNPTRADQIEALSDIHGASTRSLHKMMREENIHQSEEFLKIVHAEIKEEKVIESLKNSHPAAIIISDLKAKLLINITHKPLLTSDCPVVSYNQYFEKRSKNHISFGLGSMGIQIFVPLSSKHAIILYDLSKYFVGNDKNDVVMVKSVKDIDQLNILQFQSCLNAVYGNQNFTNKYAEFLNKKSRQFRKNRELKYKIVEDIKLNNTFVKAFNICTNLNLSFVSLTLSAAKEKLNPQRIYLRPSAEAIRQQMYQQDVGIKAKVKEVLRAIKF